MVTDRIVESLEQGIVPWQKPWAVSGNGQCGAINYVTRKPYSFLNCLLLGRTGEFITWKQAKELGGSIKKGAKSQFVVFYTQQVRKTEVKVYDPETNTEEIRDKAFTIPVLKYYNVFHIDDIEGLESKLTEEDEPKMNDLQPIEAAEAIITAYLEQEKEDGLKLYNQKASDSAYYSPAWDSITVPMMNQYTIVEEYYSTTFHEMVHSTGKESRLNRVAEQKTHKFGSQDYSREELVAEMGSAMLCMDAGLECEKAFKNSVAYINGWLQKLKSDNKIIVWASSRAEKAARYIKGEKVK